MSGEVWQCPNCQTRGPSRDIFMILLDSVEDGWQFIHFNNEEMRRPTIVCISCFAGFDIAFLTSRIVKRAPEAKVHKLMSEAFHLGRMRNATNERFIRALAQYAAKKMTN